MSEKIFSEVKKNFGFGCMRLPMKNGDVDYEQTSKMVDAFIEAGFNYFDTAHGYIDGKSEIAVRKCLTSRYPRESYVLANKLSPNFFDSEDEIIPLFEEQLKICGVEYFDFYLMHTQNKDLFAKYKRCRAYETAIQLRKAGRIKHLAISFHDTADVLDDILTTYPEVEAVQIQFNYYDYEHDKVQARLCYEVCRKHGKPIIVMEPVRGGALADLPEEAAHVLAELNGGSAASYAIRYAAGFDGIFMVLSGMGSMEMMNDNVSYMKDFQPLSKAELEAVAKVTHILKNQELIPCTACRYCTEVCPQSIAIPEIFGFINDKRRMKNRSYSRIVEKSGARPASECISCGACEASCPQHIEIRELLAYAAKTFEK